ncbi:MAG: hypothetical protein ACFFAN_14620 [Promethearchaeota archaeon]
MNENQETAEKYITNFIRECYDEIPSTIQYSLVRFKKDSVFLTTIKRLKEECWFDWQILGAIKILL